MEIRGHHRDRLQMQNRMFFAVSHLIVHINTKVAQLRLEGIHKSRHAHTTLCSCLKEQAKGNWETKCTVNKKKNRTMMNACKSNGFNCLKLKLSQVRHTNIYICRLIKLIGARFCIHDVMKPIALYLEMDGKESEADPGKDHVSTFFSQD